MAKRSDLGCRKAVVAEAPSYFTHTSLTTKIICIFRSFLLHELNSCINKL